MALSRIAGSRIGTPAAATFSDAHRFPAANVPSPDEPSLPSRVPSAVSPAGSSRHSPEASSPVLVVVSPSLHESFPEMARRVIMKYLFKVNPIISVTVQQKEYLCIG